jgi:hypothetical protein
MKTKDWIFLILAIAGSVLLWIFFKPILMFIFTL